MQTSEVLHKAADLIEERGWIQRTGWQLLDNEWATSEVCLEGAIQIAAGIDARPEREVWRINEEVNACPAGRAVADYLRADGRLSPGHSLFGWNDTRDSAAEVVEVLRATAVIEAAKEEQAAKVEAERVATS